MDLESLSCTILNMWLATKVGDIGMGRVSLFEPENIKRLLSMPSTSQPIAVLCLGHVNEFYEKPMLAMESWAGENTLKNMMYENRWGD